jgi:hypothetical protein
MSATTYRSKQPDLHLHVSYQNVKDGIANDPRNCTFGQCELARDFGMDFYVNLDPEKLEVFAEWTEDGYHHIADVEPKDKALTILAATDVAKKQLLKKFPTRGMNFDLVNHTARKHRPGENVRSDETPEEIRIRRVAKKARDVELKQLRAAGLAEPAKKRNRRIHARFGGRVRAGK